MLDMHSHILFGVDDGPKTMDETMMMLEKAVGEGVTHIIATSHSFHPQFHVSQETIQSQLYELQEEIQSRNIPISILPGQEVRLHENILESIEKNEVLTLANSRYLLLELPSQTVPAYTVNIIQSLLAENIIPIIAHPERNKAIAEKPERLERLIRHGALAQITAGSVAGYFGKHIQKLSIQLIESNLIHTYGSDMHNPTTRPMLFKEGLQYLEKKKLDEYMSILLQNNMSILKDDNLFILEPDMQKKKKWWNFIG
ncbi:tyrosine-protein phosphatase [Sporosarcina sp. SAFN-015]|uniref:tyrosine-protein phosphatase n=1 Tax=Sporosarcina sp. SAFN-015 TaxID=3387274 RepID=UPI003F804C05